MPTYCQQLPAESLLSKSPLHDRKIEDPEDNFNMSPHVLTCIELRHTHNVILFSFAIFHACSTYMFNECTGDSAHGALWSPLIGCRRKWSWSTHTRRGRWMIGGPPGMSLDVLLMGYLGGYYYIYYYICIYYYYYYYYYHYYYYWMILLLIIPDINQILLRKPCIILLFFFFGDYDQ